eukprot:m.283976 g.283976  ORF g.283976 m.283976 type:complete len:397 (+) comp40674_c1_seq9:1824-3014(+)
MVFLNDEKDDYTCHSVSQHESLVLSVQHAFDAIALRPLIYGEDIGCLFPHCQDLIHQSSINLKEMSMKATIFNATGCDLFVVFFEIPLPLNNFLMAIDRMKSSLLFATMCNKKLSSRQCLHHPSSIVKDVREVLKKLCQMLTQRISIATIASLFGNSMSSSGFSISEEIETLFYLEASCFPDAYSPMTSKSEAIEATKVGIAKACSQMPSIQAAHAVLRLSYVLPKRQSFCHILRRYVNQTERLHFFLYMVHDLAVALGEADFSTIDLSLTVLKQIATDEYCNRLNDFCTGHKLIKWIGMELRDWGTMISFVQKAKSLVDDDTHNSLLLNLYNCCEGYATLLFHEFSDLPSIVSACAKICKHAEASSLLEQWENCYCEESIEFFQEMKSRIEPLHT